MGAKSSDAQDLFLAHFRKNLAVLRGLYKMSEIDPTQVDLMQGKHSKKKFFFFAKNVRVMAAVGSVIPRGRGHLWQAAAATASPGNLPEGHPRAGGGGRGGWGSRLRKPVFGPHQCQGGAAGKLGQARGRTSRSPGRALHPLSATTPKARRHPAPSVL